MNFWRLWKTWENIGKNIENFLPFASRLRAISEENSAPFSSLVCLRQDSCHKRTTGDLWLGLGFRIGFLQELFYPQTLQTPKRQKTWIVFYSYSLVSGTAKVFPGALAKPNTRHYKRLQASRWQGSSITSTANQRHTSSTQAAKPTASEALTALMLLEFRREFEFGHAGPPTQSQLQRPNKQSMVERAMVEKPMVEPMVERWQPLESLMIT